MLIGTFVVAKATPRTVTPPTARVPPTAAAKQGLNKGSTENNHNNSVLNAQIDDLSNQVIVKPSKFAQYVLNAIFDFINNNGNIYWNHMHTR